MVYRFQDLDMLKAGLVELNLELVSCYNWLKGRDLMDTRNTSPHAYGQTFILLIKPKHEFYQLGPLNQSFYILATSTL